jgi:cobalt/nickel transport system ATP-binding protein
MHHTIEIRGLRFSYPDGLPALKGIDLFIAPSERVALVGPNGAGKSTLMLHMNGILSGEGEVLVCGTRVSESTLPEVRAAVGLVFQDPDDQLFSQTVYEDVAYGPIYMGLEERVVRQCVDQALAAVGMQGSEGRVPHHLSGGEKKRVAIATVLAMNPEILALDEPTSGLDPRSRRGLVDLLRTLPQTMLISTHDMRLVAELSSRTIVIDGGVIVADGPTTEILSDAAFLERHGLESA